MELPRYTVLFTTPGDTPAQVEETVTILHADQLRAELVAPRLGLPSMKDAPMHYTSLWCWAALVREGKYDGKPQQWKTDCLAMQALENDTGARPGEPETAADPTRRGLGVA